MDKVHESGLSPEDRTILNAVSIIGFGIAAVIGIYLGVWAAMFEWFAFHWTTIWQVLVAWLLFALWEGKVR